jgi:hypothetical protein
VLKSRQLKDLSEKISSSQEKLDNYTREISSLLKSIDELISEKNSYRAALECNKENAEEFRSPDQFLDIKTDNDGIDVWAKLLAESDSPGWLKKIRSLSRRCLPTRIRGELWGRLIGNQMNLTPKLFATLLEMARGCNKSQQEENGTILIPMDLRRTLAALQVFQEKQPLHSALSDLLQAFAVSFK